MTGKTREAVRTGGRPSENDVTEDDKEVDS